MDNRILNVKKVYCNGLLPQVSMKDDPKKRIAEETISDTTSLERDPGKRESIGKYPSNERDYIRRAYVLLGPNQPHLKCYPITYGVNGRRFNKDWFLKWPWLEYSIVKGKAYCFSFFLFDSYPSRHPQFTGNGFHGWKNMMCKSLGIINHVGGINSIHCSSMHKWENLRNPSKHIERVMSTFSSQEVADNQFRLTASIEVVKLLARKAVILEKKDIAIVNDVECIAVTKEKLQAMRDNGWDDLITKVAAFSCEHDIIMLDMSSPYKRGARRNEMSITNEHYFWVNALYAVIDSQMAELDNKFTDSSVELLVPSASFHPRNNFEAFKVEDVLLLASKFYPSDFSEHDMVALDNECGFFCTKYYTGSKIYKYNFYI
ncbi:hypothetical protein QQ045_030685 [Rhodiola kirilowii]